MSVGIATAFDPARLATFWSSVSRRRASARRWPSRVRRSASAAPMPLLAPVMTMCFISVERTIHHIRIDQPARLVVEGRRHGADDFEAELLPQRDGGLVG